jgi:hypothetical protein
MTGWASSDESARTGVLTQHDRELLAELIPAGVELRNTVVFQLLHHVVIVDADRSQSVEHLLGLGVVVADAGSGNITVLGEGAKGGFGHRVDRTGEARNLQRDPRVAISLTPADHPYSPVVLRGRVVTWLSGEEGWAVVDAIADNYIHAPDDRDQERVVGMIAVDQFRMGM